MDENKTAELYEDNAGTLHMFALDGGAVAWAGLYRDDHEGAATDWAALLDGEDADGWETPFADMADAATDLAECQECARMVASTEWAAEMPRGVDVDALGLAGRDFARALPDATTSRVYPDEIKSRIFDALDRQCLLNGTLVVFDGLVYYNERYDPTCRRDWGEGPLELEPIGRLDLCLISREKVPDAPAIYAVTPWLDRAGIEHYTDLDEAEARDEKLNELDEIE